MFYVAFLDSGTEPHNPSMCIIFGSHRQVIDIINHFLLCILQSFVGHLKTHCNPPWSNQAWGVCKVAMQKRMFPLWDPSLSWHIVLERPRGMTNKSQVLVKSSCRQLPVLHLLTCGNEVQRLDIRNVFRQLVNYPASTVEFRILQYPRIP